MKGRTKLTCATCGETFAYVATKAGGQPPKHCPKHRKKRGPTRDVEGVAARKGARKRSATVAAARASVAIDTLQAADLAAALSVFQDPVQAARFVGLAASGPQLEDLVAAARSAHAGVVEGEPAELGRRITAALHLMVTATIRQRDVIAPRDLPHVARALSQVHAVMVGDKTPRIAQLTMMVVGADGVPFDPNAAPQVKGS